MPDKDIFTLTISELSHYISTKQISPVEVLHGYIERIEKTEPRLNAFITKMFENGARKAEKAEKQILKGEYLGPLHGIPIGLKDLFWTKGTTTTSGSKMNKEFVPDENSTVANLLNMAGSYCIGKLHMTEFAFDGTSLNKHFGPAHNPWNTKHMAGGSSSGAGVAVASGQVPLAIGTDTGGSVRVPASLCGITGLKPTFGLISRFGVTPLSWSMDHVGPLAKTAKDTAIALNALVKFDPKDPDSVATDETDYTKGLDRGIKGMRVGIPRNFIWDLVDPEVKLAFDKAIEEIESLGAVVKEIINPNLELINMAGSIVQTSEAATIHRSNVLNNGDSFDPIIRMRIETGLFVTAESYIKAQQIRMDEKAKLIKQFDEIDLIATPTTSIPAPRLDQERININDHDVHIREALLRITRIFSTIGLPAISIPCGLAKNKLPLGLQLVAKPFNEQILLRAAHCFQEATNWHNLRPNFDNV